jgi:hypothetical protein
MCANGAAVAGELGEVGNPLEIKHFLFFIFDVYYYRPLQKELKPFSSYYVFSSHLGFDQSYYFPNCPIRKHPG